jgi:hypothetical protein
VLQRGKNSLRQRWAVFKAVDQLTVGWACATVCAFSDSMVLTDIANNPTMEKRDSIGLFGKSKRLLNNKTYFYKEC